MLFVKRPVGRVVLLGAVLSAVVLMALGSAGALAADTSVDLPDVVSNGLDRYAQSGAEAALQTWIAGGPLENEGYVQSQAAGLHRIEAFFGKYQGYELIRVSEITPRIRTVYLVMNFEKGPAFCYLLCYLTNGGRWVVSDFDGSTSPRRILPEYGATYTSLTTPSPSAISAS